MEGGNINGVAALARLAGLALAGRFGAAGAEGRPRGEALHAEEPGPAGADIMRVRAFKKFNLWRHKVYIQNYEAQRDAGVI
jgi:hypothetical protein